MLVGADDLELDDRLADGLDDVTIGQFGGVVDFDPRPSLSSVDLVGDGGRGLHDLDAALALESFLDDVHVQQAEEAAAEAEAQRLGVLLGWKVNEASLRRERSMASRRSS
jgi:hypothetical protein